MLTVDGSHGEGGGQILRSALALSILLDQPIQIEKIRAGRRRPGLANQHLTCVQAAAQICRADVSGGRLGSQEVLFQPGAIQPGRYEFDVQTAGSTSLVLQTIFLPLALADAPSRITLTGGTHVLWSPSTHFLEFVFLPMMRLMGITTRLHLEQWGWYPKGGGVVHIDIEPCEQLLPLTLSEPNHSQHISGISAVSNLAPSIAERQKQAVEESLSRSGLTVDIEIIRALSVGQGTAVFLHTGVDQSIAGFTALGERGKRAERVGREAAQHVVDFLASGASVQEHLADQLILPMALAEGESMLTTPRLTTHLSTNLWLIQEFLPGTFGCEQGDTVRVWKRA